MRSAGNSTILYRAVVLLFTISLLSACSNPEKSDLNIPEGEAVHTLKEFARQTNVEILFDRQIVFGVKTKAVIGQYEPSFALRIMLEDTPLEVDVESETGAYAVFRKQL